MRPRRTKINGKTWKIRWVARLGHPKDPDETWGEFDPNTKTIKVVKSLKEKDRLDTVIHEFTHGFFDSGPQHLLHEEIVKQYGIELAEHLRKHGYRCPEDEGWGK